MVLVTSLLLWFVDKSASYFEQNLQCLLYYFMHFFHHMHLFEHVMLSHIGLPALYFPADQFEVFLTQADSVQVVLLHQNVFDANFFLKFSVRFHKIILSDLSRKNSYH